MASLKKTPHIDLLEKATRIVIKVGSALVIREGEEVPYRKWMASLAADIAALHAKKKQILLVSSGSIAAGRGFLGLRSGVLLLEEKQAAAALGQASLCHAWQEAFRPFNLHVAQLLLNLDDTELRQRHLNVRATFLHLLEKSCIPLVNENDTTTHAETRFGDNDRLAARLAVMIEADSLILLSDVDGLYESDPHHNSEAKHIAQVETITPNIEKMAGKITMHHSHGGMVTKLQAAKIAQSGGCHVILASGKALNPITALREGKRHTLFISQTKPHRARLRWISGMVNVRGIVVIDGGAEDALCRGKSLLAAGTTDVKGAFGRGDAVSVVSKTGRECARGLIEYSSKEALQISGQKSMQIEKILGYKVSNCLIHKDNLALTGKEI